MVKPMFRQLIYAQLGANVRQARKSAGLTQEQLAQAVSLSRTSITNIEKGRQKILLDTLYDIAEAVGKTAIDLFPNLHPNAGDNLMEQIQGIVNEGEQAWIKSLVDPEQEK